MRARRWLTAVSTAAAVALVAGGCNASSPAGEAGGEPSGTPRSATTSPPDGRLSVVADADPGAMAVSTSRALYDRAPAVVVAEDDDQAGTLLGSSAAVGLGIPLLLLPGAGRAPDELLAELDRLDPRAVLTVGVDDAAPDGGSGLAAEGREVVDVPARAAAVAGATGLDLGSAKEVSEESAGAAVAALDPASPAVLVPPGSSRDESGGRDGDRRLPELRRPAPLDGTLVLATGSDESIAALATARAAGARIELTDGATDPRGSTDVISALAEEPADAVIALGAGFAQEDGLDWKLATAASGGQLPGGGQLLFPGRLLVALYGHPGSGALGVLGEQGIDASIARARAHAESYEPFVDVPVVPAFEIIATVASSSAGEDGNYSAEADPEDLRPWVEAAGKAGLYVVLDLQPGRTDFLTQAQQYRALLELPHVGLALDPEWRLGPDQVHLTQTGSVQVDEVNRVITWLADLTRERALPQKLLVLHQFRVDMLPGRERLDMSRDELAVMVHADGQGGQGDKQATWQALHVNPPSGLAWGWKNFYDEDSPMLTPEQTVAQVVPLPDLISYQ